MPLDARTGSPSWGLGGDSRRVRAASRGTGAAAEVPNPSGLRVPAGVSPVSSSAHPAGVEENGRSHAAATRFHDPGAPGVALLTLA